MAEKIVRGIEEAQTDLSKEKQKQDEEVGNDYSFSFKSHYFTLLYTQNIYIGLLRTKFVVFVFILKFNIILNIMMLTVRPGNVHELLEHFLALVFKIYNVILYREN